MLAQKSLIIVFSGSYPKFTWSKTTFPFKLFSFIFPFAVSISSGSSKNSNTLSAAAIIDCNVPEICAICVIG